MLALLACLILIDRRDLPAEPRTPPVPDDVTTWAAIPRRLLVACVAVIAVFAIASVADVPLGPTMTVAWLVLFAVARSSGERSGPLKGIGWSLLAFVGGMAVMVAALSSVGVTAWLAGLVLAPARDSPAAMLAVTAAAAAIGANLLNNLPAAFVFADAIHGAGLSAASVHAAAVGTIIGADLGPNLTPVGSVATLLWFVLLRHRGLNVSTRNYIRVGLIVTPVTILAALAVAVLLGGAAPG